jgi:hypothetical protein
MFNTFPVSGAKEENVKVLDDGDVLQGRLEEKWGKKICQKLDEILPLVSNLKEVLKTRMYNLSLFNCFVCCSPFFSKHVVKYHAPPRTPSHIFFFFKI